MLRTSDVVTFVTTTEPERARAFYEGVLGLRLMSDDPFALVFDVHGIMLRVSKAQAFTPAPHTVLGWKVVEIADTVAALAAKGIVFERYSVLEQDELGIWASPSGARVAWFKDPDGNVLSLTQF